jgi:hypothetical protein
METFTFTDEIARIVRRETRYLRHYWAEVLDVNDPSSKGRVKVAIPMLNWNDESTGAWCMPRDLHSMVVPNVGEFVEVYFLEGNPNKPVYLGQVHEITGGTPSQYDGPMKVILYEDPNGDSSVVFDKDAGTLVITAPEIHLNGDSKTFVTFAELDSALSSFKTALDTHVHSGVTTGPGSSGPPASPFTIDISAAETSTIKTGG